MELCTLRSEIRLALRPAVSRVSEIALMGNFPDWLETVLGFSRFIKPDSSDIRVLGVYAHGWFVACRVETDSLIVYITLAEI